MITFIVSVDNNEPTVYCLATNTTFDDLVAEFNLIPEHCNFYKIEEGKAKDIIINSEALDIVARSDGTIGSFIEYFLFTKNYLAERKICDSKRGWKNSICK